MPCNTRDTLTLRSFRFSVIASVSMPHSSWYIFFRFLHNANFRSYAPCTSTRSSGVTSTLPSRNPSTFLSIAVICIHNDLLNTWSQEIKYTKIYENNHVASSNKLPEYQRLALSSKQLSQYRTNPICSAIFTYSSIRGCSNNAVS